MNSMHNSLSGPGGYSGSYPGYVPPPSALPYYNGYPADVNQSANHYYSKPGSVPPGYATGMSPYSTPPINNSSMYYQQYGLGYQYSYGKYGLSSSLGYATDVSTGPGGVHPPTIGTLQSPSADLGLTGSMFSKSNKYSGSQGSSSPHSNVTASSVSIPTTSNTPSPGLHSLSSNYRGGLGTTQSPPCDNNEGKKDIDKMKRCQICGQVFRLMSECLAHMKAVHEAPISVYSHPHSTGGHISQPINPPHNLTASTSRHGSIGAPDSPLLALERMGWGEKQTIMSTMQSSSPIAHSYPSASSNMSSIQLSHQVNPVYGSHSLGHLSSVSQQHSPARHSSPIPTVNTSTISNQNSPSITETGIATDQEQTAAEELQTKLRRANSYSVSSIMGETNEALSECEKEETTEKEKKNDFNANREINDKQTRPSSEMLDNTEPENLVISSEESRVCQKENINNEKTKLSQVQVSISDAVTESNKTFENSGQKIQPDPIEKNEAKKEFLPIPLIIGKKDLLQEMETVKAQRDEEIVSKESESPIENPSNTIKKEENDCIDRSDIVEQDSIKSFPEDLSNATSSTCPKTEQQISSINQLATSSHPNSNQQQSPAGTYPNPVKPSGYGNWSMGIASSGFPATYPYPQSNAQSTTAPSSSKSHHIHGYHAMHSRFPQFHHGNPSSSNQYPSHPYIQNHPSGNWYPRGDSKAMWANWSNQSGQNYPHGYYGFPNQPGQKSVPSAPPPAHIHPSASQKSSAHIHFPTANSYHANRQNSPTRSLGSNSMSPHDQKEPISSSPSNLPVLSSSPGCLPVNSSPGCLPVNSSPGCLPVNSSPGCLPVNSSPQLQQDNVIPDSAIHKNDGCVDSNVINKVKKPGQKIGPKSKVMSAKQLNQLNDLDEYKCTITVRENGYASPGSTETGCVQSSDSSDCDETVDEEPKFTTLRPAKRKYFASKDGSFVGPKRIKLAKQVKERQEKRQRTLNERLRQSELEEQLQATRIEKAAEHTGPLGNILLQSSILLCEKKVEVSSSVEECIAKIKSVHQHSLKDSLGDTDFGKLKHGTGKKSGRKSQAKVFHNENSVIIQDNIASIHQCSSRKLRAKDFKWSHFIKSMRYWCNDCTHGFKNQREATMHMEEKCKINCLYMLECYVVVNDIQTHPQYGQKVQELLEEYQIDNDYNCVTCGEIIARKADYLVHVDTHKDFMPWECTICGTRFKIRGSLKEHLRYTHMKGRVPCLKCNKVFPTSTLLRQHVKVHTQHYKYKSTKNRDEELKAAMEATAGALEGTGTAISIEEGEKLSHEASEYRNWCKLMEMNAMKNITTVPASSGHEDEDSGEEGIPSADLSRSSSDSCKLEFNS